MPLHAGSYPEFMTAIAVPDGQPTTTYGIEVDPDAAANTYTTNYVEIASAAQVSTDIYFIELDINTFHQATFTRTHLLKLGLDYGSGYVDWIPDIYLPANNQRNTGFISHGVISFPCYIPAGTAIGAKTQCATAGITNGPNIGLRLWGDPRYPEATAFCSKFKSFGVTTASTTGTTITVGTGPAEGDNPWTEIGTLDDAYWWWQVTLGCQDSGFVGDLIKYDVSIGATGGARIISRHNLVVLDSAENHSYICSPIVARGKSGDKLYVRAWANTGGETLYNAAAIGGL